MLVRSLIAGCASEPPRLSAGERQAILAAPDRTDAAEFDASVPQPVRPELVLKFVKS